VSDGTVDPIDLPASSVPVRKRSSFWALLLLSAAIASAGVMMDSTVPTLGTALALVLSQRTAMLRSLGSVLGGLRIDLVVGGTRELPGRGPGLTRRRRIVSTNGRA
jgi:hypothetical protein